MTIRGLGSLITWFLGSRCSFRLGLASIIGLRVVNRKLLKNICWEIKECQWYVDFRINQ